MSRVGRSLMAARSAGVRVIPMRSRSCSTTCFSMSKSARSWSEPDPVAATWASEARTTAASMRNWADGRSTNCPCTTCPAPMRRPERAPLVGSTRPLAARWISSRSTWRRSRSTSRSRRTRDKSVTTTAARPRSNGRSVESVPV